MSMAVEAEVDVEEVLRQYGKQFRDAEMVNNVLRLPNGFLGEEGLLALWCHPNYALLEDSLVRRAGSMRKRQFHLVATPGIGKTYFGHYWFYKQAKDRKRVIWRTKAGLFLYYDFSLEEPFVHLSEKYVVLKHWRADFRTIWLVVDGGCKAVQHRGFVLQCVCPYRSGYNEFAKDMGVLCHLEAWSLEEMMECRDSLQLEFTDAELAERFYYCGGVPREVFDETKTTEDLKCVMEQVVSRAPSWEAVIGHAGHDSDYLLHYQLQRELDLSKPASDCVLHYILKFASEFVEDLVVDNYQRQGHEKVREFFNFCQEIRAAHGLSGKF